MWAGGPDIERYLKGSIADPPLHGRIDFKTIRYLERLVKGSNGEEVYLLDPITGGRDFVRIPAQFAYSNDSLRYSFEKAWRPTLYAITSSGGDLSIGNRRVELGSGHPYGDGRTIYQVSLDGIKSGEEIKLKGADLAVTDAPYTEN